MAAPYPNELSPDQRLREARTRLTAGAQDVAQIAYQLGYERPSQFTHEYTRLFAPLRHDLRAQQVPVQTSA
ncbi:helix-turn-helix domain-containing protein [Herbaspirillum sp. SJZ107]|uniref:helix-turn-helix domain-containing protein n=1 Tax=Herbaspirillum sp. SJZ107 TaxID=2572881 RepID=UPI00114FBB12